MTAKRQPDGGYLYRGVRIVMHPKVPPNKLGRYSVEGVLFTQLETARAHVDMLAKPDTQEPTTDF